MRLLGVLKAEYPVLSNLFLSAGGLKYCLDYETLGRTSGGKCDGSDLSARALRIRNNGE